MNKATRVILATLFVLGSFLIVVSTFTARGPESVLIELALGALLKYFALVITVTSTLLLIGKAIRTGSLGESLPLTLPAVVGLMLLTPHWSLGIFLCTVAIGHFALEFLKLKNSPPPAP